MVGQSLLHITLNKNHRRHSLCPEAIPEAIDLLSALIQKSEFSIPGQAAYRCDAFEPNGRCPCFQVLDANGVFLVSLGVGLGMEGSEGGSVDHLTCTGVFAESQDQDTGGGSSSPDSLVWRPSRTWAASGFPGDGMASRFYKMPFVVSARPGAEPSGPSCGMGELMGFQPFWAARDLAIQTPSFIIRTPLVSIPGSSCALW